MTYDEILQRFEDWLRRSAGDEWPLACRMCYSPYDPAGCLCGAADWTDAHVVFIELGNMLRAERGLSTFAITNVGEVAASADPSTREVA